LAHAVDFQVAHFSSHVVLRQILDSREQSAEIGVA
jgi:hypothetical protein